MNWQKSGFVRPNELFVRSCPVRPDRSRTAGPVPTLVLFILH
jgi:hypothetical protein